jgi:prepilin-type N-terminal cleavage/methylation domain-containing protein
MPVSRSYHPRAQRPGFTLIELLVVISIVALLVALILPSVTAARRLAVKVQCGSVMRQAGIGFGAYRADYNEWLIRIEPKTGSTATSSLRWNLNASLTYSQALEAYWPPAARYCPSVAKPDKTTFEWAYTSPLLDNLYAASGYMAGRSTPPGSLNPNGFVKLKPGPAVYMPAATSNVSLRGTIYRLSGKTFDPLYAQPILADYLQSTNHTSPYRIAPHNASAAVDRESNLIDSDGGHTLWEDYHLEWHLWPQAAKTVFKPELFSGSQVNDYPLDISNGSAVEGWTASGNEYNRYYFWCKQAPRG